MVLRIIALALLLTACAETVECVDIEARCNADGTKTKPYSNCGCRQ